MGPAIVKDHQITLLLFVGVLFLSTLQMSSGSAIKGPDNEKKSQFSLTSYCRKHILSPPCRGHQKRDVLSRLGEDYRLSALENDFSGVDRSGDFGAILKSPTLLGELLRKAVEASTEYDSDNGNYLN